MIKDVLYSTERLIVRKWCIEDAPHLYAYCSDPVVTSFLVFPTYKSLKDANERLAAMQEFYQAYDRGDKDAKTKVDFAVVLKQTNTPIGSIGWVGYNENAGGIIELGALLNRKYQGKSLMPEALKGMFLYIVQNNLAKRIEAKHDIENHASGACLKRAGMQFEGIRRKCITNNIHTRADAAVYSILAEEVVGINQNVLKARDMLQQNSSLTCVLVKNDVVYTSTKSGIAPMMEFIENKTDLNGFSAADRIVGKAAAMLFTSAGVESVHGVVISKSAIEVFEKHGIQYTYNTLAETIQNRKGDGICPMERAVESVDKVQHAHKKIKEEIKKMQEVNKPKPLGFGCMRMPLLDENDSTSFDFEMINNMFDSFLDNGFSHFDTAYPYHRGMSENMIKRCLVDRHPRNRFQLANKLPIWNLKKSEDCAKYFNEQLGKCGVEYFDYYLLHALNAEKVDTCNRFKAFDFGRDMRKQGKIKKFGFSFHDTPELLDKILTENPDMDFVLLQINYIDWNNPGVQSRRCYEIARKHKIPVMVMEPVKGGNLATLPADAEKLMKDFAPDLSIASWAIRYAASLEGVFMVLSGMSKPEQLKDNMSFMKNFTPLNHKEKEVIAKVVSILESKNTIPCTQCGYCVEGCPQRIAIPSYFALYNSLCHEKDSTGGFSSQWSYYSNIIQHNGKASDCIDCKQCEGVCPQHLEISKLLRENIVGMFEENNHLPNQVRKRK